MEENLKERLVNVTLEWERRFGVAPAITSVLSEYDAAMLIGVSEEDYSNAMDGRTAVSRGFDFKYQGERYQVKANRPSGKPGSKVTLVGKANNYEWDYLIWVHYNTKYQIQEAWLWDVIEYMNQFKNKKRLSPDDMRQGKRIFPS